MIELGKTGGFDVTTVEGYKLDAKEHDFSFLTPEYLAAFDGVMMMTNGNLRFTEAQKRNLLDFVRSGKGFIGAHCASLTFYDYPEFGDMLGGYFQRNLPQGTIAVLKVEDGKHPATRMLGAGWPLVDEFYLFGSAPWDAARPTTTSTRCSRTRFRWASHAIACTCCSASTPSAWICRSSRIWCAAAITRKPGRAPTARGDRFTRH